MNTLEILYQAFRVRYSLNQLQQILDRGCRIALLGPDDAVSILKGYFGDPVPPIGGEDPSDDLVEIAWGLEESDLKELRTCDACLVLFPEGPPDIDTLQDLAEKIPIHVKTLWLCLVDQPKGGAYHDKDLTLPTVQALPKAKAREKFLKLLMISLPQVVVILARNWSNVRTVFCKTLTRRTALRNGVRAGISSLPLKAVPVVGPVLSMLATTAETMMLTSSQLRLSFVIAAAHNRPLDFFDRISELWPIIGTAFGFRGVSRRLVKMVPTLGPGLKASVAFTGTYGIGEACRLYYEHGQPSSDEVRRELLRRSHEEGAKEAQRLFRKVLAGQSLEDLEEEEDGAELLDAVDKFTERDLEPTVEMDAVAEPKPKAKPKEETPQAETLEPVKPSQEEVKQAPAAPKQASSDTTSEQDRGKSQTKKRSSKAASSSPKSEASKKTTGSSKKSGKRKRKPRSKGDSQDKS